jgi:uncharacterized FlaG/YvyC family protein
MDDKYVAILIEEMRSQFRTFGEKLDGVEEKVDKGLQEVKDEINALKMQNRYEHQQLSQMISDLNQEVKKLDTEVVQLKRIK